MAFNINRATILGNIANDVVVKKTPSGKSVANISVATNHSVKNGDSWDQVATFHRVTVWGGSADYLENNARKGSKIYVEGRIENSTYQKDGVTFNKSEIIADSVILMESSNQQGRSEEINSDLPF